MKSRNEEAGRQGTEDPGTDVQAEQLYSGVSKTHGSGKPRSKGRAKKRHASGMPIAVDRFMHGGHGVEVAPTSDVNALLAGNDGPMGPNLFQPPAERAPVREIPPDQWPDVLASLIAGLARKRG
jgi:hypothetical protein